MVNQAELARREHRLEKQEQAAHARGVPLPSPVVAHQRLTQGSVKLFRWLPVPLLLRASLRRSIASLAAFIRHFIARILDTVDNLS